MFRLSLIGMLCALALNAHGQAPPKMPDINKAMKNLTNISGKAVKGMTKSIIKGTKDAAKVAKTGIQRVQREMKSATNGMRIILREGLLESCLAGRICRADCPKGKCRTVCEPGSTCDLTCAGGGCETTCLPGSSCMLTCAGGACAHGCYGAECQTSCRGGQCRAETMMRVRLFSAHERYVVARKNGKAFADDRDGHTDAASWKLIVNANGTFSFKSAYGKFLVAEANGKANANRPHLREWEQWRLERRPDGRVALRGHHGKYLVAEPNGDLNANRPQPRAWEHFRMTIR